MQGCKNLRPENVRNVDEYKGDIFYEAVANNYPDLEELNLMKMPKVTDKGVAALIKGCPKLLPGKLICRCKGILFFQALVTSRPDLTEVDLRDCDGVTDEGLAALVRKCPKLLPDKIHSRSKGEAFLLAAGTQHPNLQQIDLGNCSVSEKSLAHLIKRCKKM